METVCSAALYLHRVLIPYYAGWTANDDYTFTMLSLKTSCGHIESVFGNRVTTFKAGMKTMR